MQTGTTDAASEARVPATLKHQQVAMVASAAVLRRTRHPRAAQQLEAAAQDLAAEISAGEVGGLPRPRTCRLCGCTQDRCCPGGCVWVSAPTGVDLCGRCAVVIDTAVGPVGTADDLRAVLDPGRSGTVTTRGDHDQDGCPRRGKRRAARQRRSLVGRRLLGAVTRFWPRPSAH